MLRQLEQRPSGFAGDARRAVRRAGTAAQPGLWEELNYGTETGNTCEIDET